MNKQRRIPLAEAILMALILLLPGQAWGAGQRLTLFYANDVLGETAPCG